MDIHDIHGRKIGFHGDANTHSVKEFFKGEGDRREAERNLSEAEHHGKAFITVDGHHYELKKEEVDGEYIISVSKVHH